MNRLMLTTTAALASAALIAGCGSGDDKTSGVEGAAVNVTPAPTGGGTAAVGAAKSHRSGPSGSPARRPEREPSNAPQRTPHKAPAAAKHPKPAPPVHAPTASSGAKAQTREQKLVALSDNKRTRLVAHFARIVVTAHGFKGTHISVTAGGRAIAMSLSRQTACLAEPDTAVTMLKEIHDAVPFPRALTVAVEGSSSSLASWIQANCDRPSLPAGSGRVVLSMQGEYRKESRTFRIHSKHWTIDWVNYAAFLQIFPMQGDKSADHVVQSMTPESGSTTFDGPGKFKLLITARGKWELRVREGS